MRFSANLLPISAVFTLMGLIALHFTPDTFDGYVGSSFTWLIIIGSLISYVYMVDKSRIGRMIKLLDLFSESQRTIKKLQLFWLVIVLTLWFRTIGML